MKLASYKDGSRDGQRVVVSRDLGTAHYATAIAARMQQRLDEPSLAEKRAIEQTVARAARG